MTQLKQLYFGFSSDLPENSSLHREDKCIEGVFFSFDNLFGCDYEVCISYQLNYKVVRTFLHCLANRFVSAVK